MTFPTHRSASVLVCSLFVFTGVFASTETGVAQVPADAVTKVTFSVLSACGSPSFAGQIGGTDVGAIVGGPCDCSAPPQKLVITDPALLALAAQPLCSGVSVKLNSGSPYLSWIKAEVTRPTGTEYICLADPSGSACSTVSVCSGFVETTGPANWAQIPGDLDGDGANNCVDPDLDGDGIPTAIDTCPLIADPTNLDSNGDGIGDACTPAPPEPLAVVTVPWLGDRARPHEVYPGGRIVLQGVAVLGDSDTPATVASATWDPGDGTGPVAINPADGLALELFHTYQGSPGQRYTATLHVTDATDAVASDTFLVIVKDKTIDVEVNMAVDAGLWHQHKQILRDESEGVKVGALAASEPELAAAGAVQAWAVNNHFSAADSRVDPYVHDVNRLLRRLETHLTAVSISPKSAGNPDVNGNGLGVRAQSASGINHVTGLLLSALVTSGQPDRVAVLGPANVRGRQYRHLAQDMADYLAYVQIDSSHAIPARGRWDYMSANGSGLNTIGQWVAGGLNAAERGWGLTIPAFVKTENGVGVSATWNPDGSFGDFDVSATFHERYSTPAGLIQLILGGPSSQLVSASYTWLAAYQRTQNNYHVERDFGMLYPKSLAYRLSREAGGPRTLVDDNPADGVPAWDWFRNDPPAGAPAAAGPVGIARAVLSSQDQTGRFVDQGQNLGYNGAFTTDGELTQAWALLTLSPSVFEAGPRAVCSATTRPSSGTVTLDGSESFHLVDGRPIVNYAWALSDGTSATGAGVVSPFAGPSGSLATLTVSDDRGNTHTSSCVVVLDDANRAPSLSLPADQLVEATSADGATVSYTATSSDPEEGSLPVVCGPASGATFDLGTTTVTCTATDTPGATATGSFSVTVVDTTAPTLAGATNRTVAATSPAGAVVTFTLPTATDLVDAAPAVSCTAASGSMFALGDTPVTCTATDASGNHSEVMFTVTVTNTAPSLSLPADQVVEATSTAGATATFTATGSDIEEGTLPAVCVPASGTTFVLGTTTVTCTVTDAPGATAVGSFAVTVEDTTAPALTGMANLSMPATSAAGAVVTFTSPAATDAVDAAPAVSCTAASGSIFVLGDTPVTCTATDASGNHSEVMFTVTVTNSAPSLSLPADQVVEATSTAGATATFTASGSDLEEGTLPAVCVPASGTTFVLGTTTVTCTVTDAPGATAVGSFAVTVEDTTAPALTGMANLSVPAVSATGAVVTFASPSATDAVDAAPAVSCAPASGSTFAIGDTPVACTATDAAGNSASVTFTVTVTNNAPTFTPPVNQLVEATGATGAIVSFTATGSDVEDGPLAAICAPASGSMFAIGTTTVTCTVTDTPGASASGAFTVTVTDSTTPGEMRGEGFLRTGADKYQFKFDVRESGRGERGSFSLEINYGPPEKDDKKGKAKPAKQDDDRFRSTAITFVAFSDDPTIRPGRARKPQVDSVLFTGVGIWNSSAGHTFEVRAVDQGEPGRHRESVSIVIRNRSGAIVAEVSGDLAGGNVQSKRIDHGKGR